MRMPEFSGPVQLDTSPLLGSHPPRAASKDRKIAGWGALRSRRSTLARFALSPGSFAARRRTGIKLEVGTGQAVLSPLLSASRLRLCLATKFGSLRKAFKYLDKSGAGTLTCQELRDGLVECGMAEPEQSKNIQVLYKAFDTQGAGVISISDFIGDANEAPPDDSEEWRYLTTAEKWTRWCDRTSAEVPAKPRPALWQMQSFSSFDAIQESEEKRARELQRMRTMIAQGIHKTESGLRLTAPHLLADVDGDAVQAFRREALEVVELSGKRVRHALQESARSRHDLQGCVQQLRCMEEEARKAEKKKLLVMQRQSRPDQGRGGNRIRVSAIMTQDMVNMFSGDS